LTAIFRRFKVANLTDQDVGILAKESAERGGEVQADCSSLNLLMPATGFDGSSAS